MEAMAAEPEPPVLDTVVIHYAEIALKGGNRVAFEKLLAASVRASLGGAVRSVRRRRGAIVCRVSGELEAGALEARLGMLPGIANFSLASSSPLDMKKISARAVGLLRGSDGTFKVKTRRQNKKFPLDSHAIDCAIGDAVIAALGLKVDVKSPRHSLYIEIGDREALLYLEKIEGVGGLPTGSGARLVSLLSGGIDSPVASFMMMKRGCTVILAHMLNKTVSPKSSREKAEALARRLALVQGACALYVVPFGPIQKKIIAFVPAGARMVIYRRFMARIACRIAEKEGAMGIVTGDSFGQVASQTGENLRAIHAASGLPVYSPLIGMNKEETVALAKKIGTYETSIIPSPDCCSFMVAPHPDTRMKLEEAAEMEAHLEIGALVEEAAAHAERMLFRAGTE
jgi:thiamine biosynthesis protein ThiI